MSPDDVAIDYLIYCIHYCFNCMAFFLFCFVFFRESLIDKRIESAVSQMQSVIELGRVIRERKTLPIKVSLCQFTSSI